MGMIPRCEAGHNSVNFYHLIQHKSYHKYILWGRQNLYIVILFNSCKTNCSRRVAQFGRALRSGRRGRRFKSCRIDSLAGASRKIWKDFRLLFLFYERIVGVWSTEQFVWILLTPTSFCKWKTAVAFVWNKIQTDATFFCFSKSNKSRRSFWAFAAYGDFVSINERKKLFFDTRV